MAHTYMYQGAPVLVHLKNGEKFRGKFESKKSRYIVVSGRRVPLKDLRELSYYKPRNR